MTPEDYCARKAAPPDSDRQLALVFIGDAQRPVVEALLALDAELRDIVHQGHDPSVALARLEWWRQELERAREGEPQHPVSRRLDELELFVAIAPEYLEEMCDAVETDLTQAGFATFQELALYCYRSAGVGMALIQELTADDGRDAIRAARDIGVGVRLTELLARIGHEARLGRVYIAGDALREHGMDIQGLTADGPLPALRKLLDDYAARASEYLGRGMEAFAAAPPRQHYPLVTGALAARRLRLMRKHAFPDLMEQPRSGGPARTWTAWRAARGRL